MATIPVISMALHAPEVAHLKEMRKDLRCAISWIDDILEIDELDCEETLIKAALVNSYVSSVERRIKVVIDSINVEPDVSTE